ncbi:hypothetical protein QJQ45_008788 [Haematococcus lacustris]|nr:hypothetical protein QJQ45_008788 [Haematococcus lacustris]
MGGLSKRTKAGRANRALGPALAAAAQQQQTLMSAATEAAAATEAELEEARSQLRSCQSVNMCTATDLQVCQERLHQSQQALQQSEHEVLALQVSLHRYRSELSAAKQELAACKSKVRSMGTQLAAMRAQLATAKRAMPKDVRDKMSWLQRNEVSLYTLKRWHAMWGAPPCTQAASPATALPAPPPPCHKERDTVTGAYTAAYACSNAALLTLPNVSCQQLGLLRTAVAAAEFHDALPQPQAGLSTVRRHQLMLTCDIQRTFEGLLRQAPAIHIQMDGCTITSGKVVLYCASAAIPAAGPRLPTLAAGPPTPAQILAHGQEPSRILCRVLAIRKCRDSTAAAQAQDLEQLLTEANLWGLLASVTVDSAASNVGRTALVLIALQLNYRCFGLGSRRTQAHSSLMSSSNPTYRVDYERFHVLPAWTAMPDCCELKGTMSLSKGVHSEKQPETPFGDNSEKHSEYLHAHTNELEDMQPCEQPSTLPEPDMYAPHAGLLPHTRYPHAHNSEPEDAQPCEQPSTRPGPATLAPHAGLLPCTRYPYAHTNNPEDEQPCDQLSTLPRPAKYTPHADPLPCTRYPHANTKETEDEQLGEQPSMRPGPAMHAGMPPRTRYPHAYTNETEDEQPCAQPSMLPGPAVYAPHAGMPPRSRYPHAHTNGVKDEQPYEVIEMYLRIHYGLAVQSIAQLNQPSDWSADNLGNLAGQYGDVRHTRFIRREIWIADPLEATTPSALAAHFRDHLDPIDLTTDHTEARETTAPLHATTTNAETSCTTDSTRRATAEGIPPHDEPTRLRQRRDTPTVTLRPQTTTRIHRPTTPLDNATDAAKKRVRVTKRHGDDTHTQTLMFKYLYKPTAKTHNTGPVSTIDEAPKSTPDIDLGTNQHHSPPPPPTPNRQHITLTTFNVRGLHRSRNEVLNLVHSQSPDILILTETMTQPRSNNPSSGWLKRVMPNYTVHRHQGHSEVLIGIRHDLAIQMQATMIQPCTDADVNTRCVILSLRQRQSEELTLVATYWPSGNNDDALPVRKKMQEYIRTATGHLPGSLILAGDINATMKTEDRSEHTEYTQDTMMRKFATEMRLSEADSGDRAWTYQQPHCNSRIDAILTRDARHGPEHCTHVDTNAYLSDHRPLTATLSTARLGIDLAAPQKPQKHSHTILTTPITNKDREAYRLAVQQPSSGAPQLHAHLTAYLAPMYTDAIHFLTTIDKANPQQPQRLTDRYDKCGNEGMQARQGVDTTENHVQASLAQLTNSYRDQIHKLDDDDSALAIAQARVRMQQLISTQPKKANKYILRPSRTDHKGLQALADPITNKICTAPADLNRIITDAYGTKLAPPTPKTGNYTNTQTRNYPWARAKADDPFTMHTCQNVHWLHTAIMDKAGFQECLSRLSGGKAPGPDGIENEIIKMLPWEMGDTIHQLFIIMWATGCTPTRPTSDTCLLYKDKGQETDLNSYRPVGLANTVYKLWTSLITKILTEYAEANGMLSKNQAGFRSHRNTTQQLQMLVMALEDAKLAKADIYALLVDFTSAFNTTCQDKLLWIMHDLGFPTDATDAVKDLYTGATTRFRTPYGPTNPVPVDRGTIQGDSLSPFLFLIYIEPLLRWLQVGARGYKFKSATVDSGERAIVSSIDYADDIAILCNTLRNLRCQADKLSAFSDWGHLVISHSKTLATAALHHSVETGMCSNAAEADKRARQQLQTVSLQGKPVTYHRPTSPFTYLGVLITMTLDWKPQHTAMITQLRQKLERLRRSFASARQAIHIIRTAIIPSLAYSFCAVPCTPGDLELYDRSINQCVKLKLRLPLGTPNAIVREDAGKLGMGISSTAQEYHARNTTALTQSLQSTDVTHAHISRSMLHKQITWLNTQANTQGHRMLTLFHHTLRARQLVYTSLAGLSATEGGLPLYPEECHTLGRLITQANSSHAHDVVSASITCLKSLGITHACELSCEGNTHIITGSMLTSKYGKKVKQKHIIALNKLAAMAAQPSCPDATATRTIRDSRNTSLTLPPDQRKITPWAAGLTELAPTPAVPDTRTRYMDMKAYAPTRLKAGTKRTKDGRHVHTIPADIVRIPGLDLPGLSSWKVDKACRCKLTDLGHILGAMYDHQEVITNIDGWQWDGINKESYYKVHWKPTVIERWALHLCAKEGYTPTHIETISREEAKDVCTCELCWLPRGDCPTCHNCKRAYHPACLEKALLSGHKELGYWLCPICKFGSNDFKTTMRQSAHSDLIRLHWRPTLEPAPLITAHLDYTAKRNIYDEENRTMQEERHARPDANLPDHTRQGLPDPHTWLPRCTNLHSKATFHTYPINPQTDIVGTGKCETFLQLHPHMTTPAMSSNTGEPIMPKHDLVQHVTVHDESGRTVGLLTKQQHQHLHAWLRTFSV